jgi:hypothetical protein
MLNGVRTGGLLSSGGLIDFLEQVNSSTAKTHVNTSIFFILMFSNKTTRPKGSAFEEVRRGVSRPGIVIL